MKWLKCLFRKRQESNLPDTHACVSPDLKIPGAARISSLHTRRRRFSGVSRPLRRIFSPKRVPAFAVLLLASYPTLAAGQPLLFVIAGQSNAVGMAPVPSGLTYANEGRIHLYGNDAQRHTPAREPIDTCAGQVDAVSCDPQAAAGMVLPMVDAILQARPNDEAILVPCARSGSSIWEWQRDLRRDTLYGSCVARVRESMQGWQDASGVPVARVTVLWVQGETDAQAGEVFRTTWGQRFGRLRADFRADLGGRVSWLLGVLRPDPPAGYPAWLKIRGYQTAARDNDPQHDTLFFAIGWPGLTYDASGIHINLASYQTVGGWAAQKWLKLAP